MDAVSTETFFSSSTMKSHQCHFGTGTSPVGSIPLLNECVILVRKKLTPSVQFHDDETFLRPRLLGSGSSRSAPEKGVVCCYSTSFFHEDKKKILHLFLDSSQPNLVNWCLGVAKVDGRTKFHRKKFKKGGHLARITIIILFCPTSSWCYLDIKVLQSWQGESDWNHGQT